MCVYANVCVNVCVHVCVYVCVCVHVKLHVQHVMTRPLNKTMEHKYMQRESLPQTLHCLSLWVKPSLHVTHTERKPEGLYL